MQQFIKTRLALAMSAGMILFFAGTICLRAQETSPDGDRISSSPTVQRTDDQNPSAATAQKTDDSQNTSTFAGESAVGKDYVIGPEDVLQIHVFEVNDLNETVRVANDGTIAMPLLGPVTAAGLTPDELRNNLERELGKNLLQHPQVSVFVAEYHAQPVSVIGAVEKPGLYQITGPRTLVEMLSMAGGLSKRTSGPAGSTLYVTRSSGFSNVPRVPGIHQIAPNKVEINIKSLLYSHNDGLNIPIKPRDIISVARADVIYVTGRGVMKAGGFLLEDRDQVTVLQALAMAEGLSPDAAKNQARILHTKEDGSKVETRLDLDKILKDKAPDPVLAANDILFVPNNAEKAALKRGSDIVLSTLSGILIFRP